MADGEQSVFESLTAIFQVRDLPEALAFYKDLLGFEVGWTWGEPPTYASVCRDRVEINFGAPKEGQAITPSSIYIVVTDVDAYHDAIRARGATVAVPIGDRDYGMRDFTVVDPSGNRISYGQATRG
jgi:uncharacterized glyoxalase superfamily protein PhnB